MTTHASGDHGVSRTEVGGAGELRGGSFSTAQKKEKGALEVRMDARKRKGVRGEAGDNHGGRKWRKTAAAKADSDERFLQPGGEMVECELGKWERGSWGLKGEARVEVSGP